MPIKDNRDYQDAMNMAKTFARVSWLAPVLRHLGTRGRDIASGLDRMIPLTRQVQELVELPDRFNKHFTPLGWIASEALKADAMKGAVALGDAGTLTQADELLVEEHGDADWLEFAVNRLVAVKAFRPRRDLILLALEDHVGQRYHASVPVVLAQMDGLVSRVSELASDQDLGAESIGESNRAKRRATGSALLRTERNGGDAVSRC